MESNSARGMRSTAQKRVRASERSHDPDHDDRHIILLRFSAAEYLDVTQHRIANLFGRAIARGNHASEAIDAVLLSMGVHCLVDAVAVQDECIPGGEGDAALRNARAEACAERKSEQLDQLARPRPCVNEKQGRMSAG